MLNQKQSCKDQCQDFFIKDDYIYVLAMIDGVMDTVHFDIGITANLVIFTSDENFKKNALKKKSELPQGKSILYYDLSSHSVETELFKCTNCLTTTIFSPPPSINCDKSSHFEKKMIGYFLMPDNYALSINFTNKKICLYDTIQPNITGYTRVKSLFENSCLYIFLTINGVECKFLFDTGNSSGLLLNRKKHPQLKEGNDICLEGILFEDMNGSFLSDTSIIRESEKVYYTVQDYQNNEVCYIGNLHENNMGMEFISQLDWIIDAKNKKVFVKPVVKDFVEAESKESYHTVLRNRQYVVDINEGQLTIITRVLSNYPVYPLFSVIKSVNGEIINSENICYYMKLLNETPNWESLQVKFIDTIK